MRSAVVCALMMWGLLSTGSFIIILLILIVGFGALEKLRGK